MTGDGTNDAPALAQADVAVAMNTGTQAAKEAGNMVDLDSNPTKLLDIVEIGKQLLMTRGALTTFSVANDIAKYFAIIPAAFAGTYPALGALDVMGLHSPDERGAVGRHLQRARHRGLIPLALRGVRYRPAPASALLRRNLLVYGLGGVVVPFIGIKLIDLLLVSERHLPCARSSSASRLLARAHRADRRDISAARDRGRPIVVPGPGWRQPAGRATARSSARRCSARRSRSRGTSGAAGR
jgi:hypothetical protein